MRGAQIAIGLGVSALGALVAWYFHGRYFPAWNEEVQLSDGRITNIHRSQSMNSEGQLIATELTVDLPELGGRRTWKEFLTPAIVDVYDGKVYVVGSVTYKSAWQYQNPRYGYVAFVFADGQWRRVPFIGLPDPIRTTENIPFCARGKNTASWKEKQRGWCNPQGDFVAGASRRVELPTREKNFGALYALSRTIAKSE